MIKGTIMTGIFGYPTWGNNLNRDSRWLLLYQFENGLAKNELAEIYNKTIGTITRALNQAKKEK